MRRGSGVYVQGLIGWLGRGWNPESTGGLCGLLAESDHNAIWSVVDVTDGQGETFPLWGNKYPNWNKNELMTRKNLRNVAQKYTAVVQAVKDGITRVILKNNTLKAEKLPRNRTRKN